MGNNGRTVSFSIGEMIFEYDEEKNQINKKKHHVSFKVAARVFLIIIGLNCLMKITVFLKTDSM